MIWSVLLGIYLGIGFLVGVVNLGTCVRSHRTLLDRRHPRSLWSDLVDFTVCAALTLPICMLGWPFLLL